jgi:hypothetical protein
LLCSGPGAYFRNGNSHCYTAHTDADSEERARAVCQAEGGDLWTVTSDAEGADVTSKLSLDGELWLGLLTGKTSYNWISGETPKYTKFAAGEPSDVALRCVAFDAAAQAWRSQACATKLGFVCERAPAFVFPDTHHGDRLHTAPADAATARGACEADGGYLATLQTAAERLFVGKSLSLGAWLDASDDAVEGQFVWSTGEAVDGASFAAGQPDDTDGTQNCLLFNAGDRYADANCSEKHAFVCEFD